MAAPDVPEAERGAPPKPSGRRGVAVRRGAAAAVVLVAVAARIAVGTIGVNYDVMSWAVVAAAVESGANVYAATDRYNYGPVWSWVVTDLAWLAETTPSPARVFPLALSALLALVDLAIAGLLLARFGSRAAAWFLLNPVSIMVSGFGRQFGNLAVLVGLAAALVLERASVEPRRRLGAWLAALLLGVSLAVKHILFAFGGWLAVRPESWRRRLLLLAVPPAVFALSFVPYWSGGHHGIVRNVLLYRSFHNAPMWHLLLPGVAGRLVPPMALFLVALAGFGVVSRRQPPAASLLLYTAVLVAFSPSLAVQYLAIPVAFCAVWRNPLTLLYSGLATLFMLTGIGPELLRRWAPPETVSYPVLVGVLALAVVWVLWHRQLAAVGRRVLERARGGG